MPKPHEDVFKPPAQVCAAVCHKVAAGLCGGLNLSFFIDPASSGLVSKGLKKSCVLSCLRGPTDSEVGLEDARKGEKVDKALDCSHHDVSSRSLCLLVKMVRCRSISSQ